MTAVLLTYLARERISRASDDVAGPAQEAGALRARLSALADLVADGSMTAAEYRPRADRLRRDLEGAEARAAEAMRGATLAGLPHNRDDLATLWDTHDVEWRRMLLRATPMVVTIYPPGRGARTFDPTTVEITWRTV